MMKESMPEAGFLEQRAADLEKMNNNVFTKFSGILDEKRQIEWLINNSAISAIELGKLTIESGIDRYGQQYWLVSQPNGLRFSTIPDVTPIFVKSKTAGADSLKYLFESKDVSICGQSDFGGFTVTFGSKITTEEDFLIITNDQGRCFMLYADYSQLGASKSDVGGKK